MTPLTVRVLEQCTPAEIRAALQEYKFRGLAALPPEQEEIILTLQDREAELRHALAQPDVGWHGEPEDEYERKLEFAFGEALRNLNAFYAMYPELRECVE